MIPRLNGGDNEIGSARAELVKMEADAKASGSAVMARIAMAQEATVKRLEAERDTIYGPRSRRHSRRAPKVGRHG